MKEPLIQVTVRQSVALFALAMEEKLQDNDHKGTWDRCTLGYLFKRLREETEELQTAATDGHVMTIVDAVPWTEACARRTLHEAADVANFAMMIADVCAKRAKR